jgi:hypothetical protein
MPKLLFLLTICFFISRSNIATYTDISIPNKKINIRVISIFPVVVVARIGWNLSTKTENYNKTKPDLYLHELQTATHTMVWAFVENSSWIGT